MRRLSIFIFILFSSPIAFGTAQADTCTYALSPAAEGFASSSALGSITVTPSSNSCSWTAASNDSWLSIRSGGSGTGSGAVDYSISDNSSGISRKGTMSIGGQTVTIRQAKSVFMDDPNNAFSTYIYRIYTEGITVGCATNYYCPSNNVTRGEMAAFIMRAKYGENFSYPTTPYFSDVPSNNVFFPYVQKMKDTAITSLTDTYLVSDYVTRQEMAFICQSAAPISRTMLMPSPVLAGLP